jgi:hypothetical protein
VKIPSVDFRFLTIYNLVQELLAVGIVADKPRPSVALRYLTSSVGRRE